jgi:hypothetical protein
MTPTPTSTISPPGNVFGGGGVAVASDGVLRPTHDVTAGVVSEKQLHVQVCIANDL